MRLSRAHTATQAKSATSERAVRCDIAISKRRFEGKTSLSESPAGLRNYPEFALKLAGLAISQAIFSTLCQLPRLMECDLRYDLLYGAHVDKNVGNGFTEG